MLRFPILRGPLRGVRWRLDGGGKVLRVLNGTYEPEQTRLAVELVRPGATVLDVGAHIGYYTLLFSRLAGPHGRVVAFEPSPRNLPVLRWHVARNRCANVRVEAAAVAAETGTARFTADTGSGTGRLAESGTVEVRTIRLDDFLDAGGPMPDVLKIDVEGAELAVLRGAARVLRDAQPAILLSTHGTDVHRACIGLLREHGYEPTPILGGDVERAPELLCMPAGAARP